MLVSNPENQQFLTPNRLSPNHLAVGHHFNSQYNNLLYHENNSLENSPKPSSEDIHNVKHSPTTRRSPANSITPKSDKSDYAQWHGNHQIRQNRRHTSQDGWAPTHFPTPILSLGHTTGPLDLQPGELPPLKATVKIY